MSSTSDQPLSALAASLMEADSAPEMHREMHHAAHHDHGCSASGWWAFVFYFLVLALVFYFLYFALRPYFVLKQDKCDDSHSRSFSDDRDGEIDNGRLLGAAIVTALILIFIFWVLSFLASY